MKRLDGRPKEKKDGLENKNITKNGLKKISKDRMTPCLPIVVDRQEAIDSKIDRLQGKIFGKPINKLRVGEMRDVWVPYGYYIYEFEIGKNSGLLKMHRSGEIHIVYDMNERHCVQFDQDENNGPLRLKKRDFSNDERPMLKSQADREQAISDVEYYIQRKVMAKTFGKSAKLKLLRHIQFYRPAVEMNVFFKDENHNIRFAYLDEYAVTSEHILGMKYRITQ